jgi:hypothetical protein
MNTTQIKEAIMAISNSLGLISVKSDDVFVMANCREMLNQLANIIEPQVVDQIKEEK